jgi:indole-3-glycerol phosphate synthase
MVAILQKIVAARLARLNKEKQSTNLQVLEEKASEKKRPLNLSRAFSGGGINVIAEVKKASPSKGMLREDLDPASLAGSYEKGGAAALSIVTEQEYFHGSLFSLEQVREKVSLPIIRKDFILDPYQVVEARAAGADSFLLIVACLDVRVLKSLILEGRKWHMEPVVEVHDISQLQTALRADARVIGINNRDLDTFRVDLNVTLRLAAHVPKDIVTISESGISTREDILRLVEGGVCAFLIGTALVTSPDPATKIRELVHGA